MHLVLKKPIEELAKELGHNVIVMGSDDYYLENITRSAGSYLFAFLMAKKKQNDKYLVEWHFTTEESNNPPKVKVSVDRWEFGYLVPVQKENWTKITKLYDIVFHKSSIPDEVKSLFQNAAYFGVESLA